MRTTGGRICMQNKGICCCFVFFCLLCAVWVVNCRQVLSEKQEGERGSGRPMCLKQNTADTVMFYGSDASSTNWLQTLSLLSVHSTLLFPRSRMLRGHGENSLLLVCGASWAVGGVERRLWWMGGIKVRGEERGSCP